VAGTVDLPALLAKIKIDDKEYKAGIGNVQTALDKLEQKMRSTFSSMENIGKKAAIPFAALTAALGGVTKAAGDLETATIRLSAAVQGDTKEFAYFADAVKRVRAGSEETLTTITNVMARAKLLGTELGLTNEQIAELTLVSENLSTIWGGDMQTALEGLMYGMAGMTRGLKQYGIFADDVRLKERLRAKGLNDDLNLLTATQKSQLIYETIMESVQGQLKEANAAGASFNTQVARVKNAFIDLAAAVGKNFLGDFTKSITSFADKIIAISQSPALTELIARLLKIGVVLTGVGVAIGIIGKLGNISLSLLHAGFTMLTNPILITVAAIALLLANLDKIRVAWDTANIENMGEYWNQLVTSLSTGDFSGAISAGLKIVIAPIKWLWEGIEEAYTSLAGIIGEDIRTSVDALKTAIDKGNYFEALGFALGVVANAVWQGIEWGMATATLISENIGKEWEIQKAVIENEWNTGSKATAAIAAVVFATWNGIKWTGKQFEEAGKTLSAVINEDWDTQVAAVKALWENGDKLAATIVAIATGTWQGLKWSWKQAEGAYNTISEVINADWETQKAAIQGEWDKGNYISAVITAAVTGTWQGLKWAWKQAIGAYNTISSVINADWETQKKAIGLAWAGGDYVSAIITAAVTGTWQGLKWAWGQAKKTYETLSAVLGEDWETQKAAIGTLWTSGDYLAAGIVAVATATWSGLKWAWGVGETTYQSLSKVLGEDWEVQKAEVVRLWNGEKKIEAGLVAFVSAVWSGIRWGIVQGEKTWETLSSEMLSDWDTQLEAIKKLWREGDYVAATISAVVMASFQGVKWVAGVIGEIGTLVKTAYEASSLKTDIEAFKKAAGETGFSVATVEAGINVILSAAGIVVNVLVSVWETVKNKLAVALGLSTTEETAKNIGAFDVIAQLVINIGNIAISAITYVADFLEGIVRSVSNSLREKIFGGEKKAFDEPINIGDVAIILSGVIRLASTAFTVATDFFNSMNAAIEAEVKKLKTANQKISVGVDVSMDAEAEILTKEINAFAAKVWGFFKAGFLLVANIGELIAEAFQKALTDFTGSPEIAKLITKISETLVFVVTLKLAVDALTALAGTIMSTLGLVKGAAGAAAGYILPVTILFAMSFLGDSVEKPVEEVKKVFESIKLFPSLKLNEAEYTKDFSDFQKRLYKALSESKENPILGGIANRLLEVSGKSGIFKELEAGFDAALIYAYDFLDRLGIMIQDWVQKQLGKIPGIGEMLVGKKDDVEKVQELLKAIETKDTKTALAVANLMQEGAPIEKIQEVAEAITKIEIPTDINAGLNNALNSAKDLDEQMKILAETMFGMTVDELANALNYDDAVNVINAIQNYLQNEVFRDAYTLKIDADISAVVAKLKALNIKNLPELKLQGKQSGGYTGELPENQVAGVVHGGEWVAPAWMIRKFPELFETLETARFRGYQEGGYVGSANGIVSGAGSAIGTSLDTLKNVVDYISDTFLKIIDNLQGVLGEETAVQLRTLVEGMKKYVGEMPGLYKEGLQQIDALSNELSSMGDDFKETNTAMETAANKLSNATNAIQEQAASLGVGVTDIASAVQSAFSANTYEEFVSNFSQSLEEMTKQALINAFLSSEVAKASMEKLSSLFVAAVKDGTISSEELSGIKAAEQELQGLMKNTWDVLAGLGYVNKPEEQTASTEKQDTAFTKFQNFLMEQAKKIFETIKNFVINPLKDGMSKVLSPAFKRLQEPLYRLGLLLGEILLPVVEALTPIFEALAIGLAYVINVIIGVANAVISLVNLIPSVNIPTINYIDIAKLKEGFASEQEESEYSNETTAGWNQPITNNFAITFTGNTILDTDDKSLEVLSDALIRYWKDKGVKVFA